MITSQEVLLEKLWQEKYDRRTELITQFNSSMPWEEDHINLLEVDDYAWKNYWSLTSSKFKMFLQCKSTYYYKYELLLPEPFKKKWSHFFLWTAFDQLRTLTLINGIEKGTEMFLEEYFVSMRVLKADYVKKLTSETLTPEYLNSLKVDQLRAMYEETDSRTRLPVNDWNKLMCMMKETDRNADALDTHGDYEHQKFFATEYRGSNWDYDIPIRISGTLDRYSKRGNKSTIRDWKTTSRLYNLMDNYDNTKLSQILEQIIDDFGYYYQLGFYTILDRVNNPDVKEQEIYLDFVSVLSPFNSIVLKIDNKKVLNIINTYILPWLDQFEHSLVHNDWESDMVSYSKDSYYLYGDTSNNLVVELE